MAKKESSSTVEKDALKEVMDKLNKAYGDGTVYEYKNYTGVDRPRLKSGSLSIDFLTGGGWARGVMNYISGFESAGKSTLCLYAIAEAQKEGLKCVYVDHEYCFDKAYAESLGVNVDELIVTQPGCMEDGYQILIDLCKTGKVGLVVFDSIAAAQTRKELEGDVGDQTMGVKAKLNSITFPKICQVLSEHNIVGLFVNQLREKIGISYGCLHADTKLVFTDGRSFTMREVVDNKINGCVYSINNKTGKIEEKPITGWHNNGNVKNQEDFISIKTTAIDSGGGVFGITVTPNHKVLVNDTWLEAAEINVGDNLTSKYTELINGSLKEFLLGTLVGGSSVKKGHSTRCHFSFQDNENIEYVQWKISKLSKAFSFYEKGAPDSKGNNKGFKKYVSAPIHELAKISSELGNRNPLYMLQNNPTWLSLAVWIMDDGHYDAQGFHNRYKISIKRLKKHPEIVDKIVKLINQIFNLDCRSYKDGCLHFNKEDTLIIASNIREYVPNCMQYKLPKIHQGFYKDFELDFTPIVKTQHVKVIEKRLASLRQMRQKGKYDITVADNHNYMVGGVSNGVIVHNSPITEPGGNALKFYPSIKIEVKQSTKEKDSTGLVTGNLVKAKCTKNKTSRPFLESEYIIEYGLGINHEKEILDFALELGIVSRGGSWYSYGDTKLGQGEANVVEVLRGTPELLEELESLVRTNLGI